MTELLPKARYSPGNKKAQNVASIATYFGNYVTKKKDEFGTSKLLGRPKESSNPNYAEYKKNFVDALTNYVQNPPSQQKAETRDLPAAKQFVAEAAAAASAAETAAHTALTAPPANPAGAAAPPTIDAIKILLADAAQAEYKLAYAYSVLSNATGNANAADAKTKSNEAALRANEAFTDSTDLNDGNKDAKAGQANARKTAAEDIANLTAAAVIQRGGVRKSRKSQRKSRKANRKAHRNTRNTRNTRKSRKTHRKH